MGTQAEYLHSNLLVEVDVEDGRVFVGFVSEEYGYRGEHDSGYGLAEPHRPLVVARHLHAGVLEDVVDNEHEHRHNDGHTQSALADDGPQRSTDKEEDDAGEGQRKLIDGLYLVGARAAMQVLWHR